MLSFYDFFAGVGMAELGLTPDWTCVWANDFDRTKAEMYRSNFPNPGKFRLDDINNVTAAELPGQADMAWASFPCQDLSLAGWRRGLAASRSGTFWSFHRLMRELREADRLPRILVLENVVGMLYDKEFAGLCEALADLGLQFGALVIDAKHFVPQSRPRVFVVAVDSSLDVLAFANPLPSSDHWCPPALLRAYKSLTPELRSSWRWWRLPRPSARVEPLMSLLDWNDCSASWNSDEYTDYLLSLMTETNLAKVEKAKLAGVPSVGLLYRRTRAGQQRAEIRFDGVAGCLRTATGGSSRQTVLVVDGQNVRSRLLNPREAARLMGVPDTFKLDGRFNDAYRSMGDGVVVPVVSWLGKHLLTPLAIALRLHDETQMDLQFYEETAVQLLPDLVAISQ